MMMRKIIFPLLCFFFPGTIFLLGAFLSLKLREPHIMERAGALIAACAALSVAAQVSQEIIFAEKERKIEKNREPVKHNNIHPITIAEEEIQRRENEIKLIEIKKSRMLMSLSVASIATLGEVLHGFGDILISIIFDIAPH